MKILVFIFLPMMLLSCAQVQECGTFESSDVTEISDGLSVNFGKNKEKFTTHNCSEFVVENEDVLKYLMCSEEIEQEAWKDINQKHDCYRNSIFVKGGKICQLKIFNDGTGFYGCPDEPNAKLVYCADFSQW